MVDSLSYVECAHRRSGVKIRANGITLKHFQAWDRVSKYIYANPNLIADSISHIRHELSKELTTYNAFRPHFNLHGLTPLENINSSHPEAA
jgi:hypothetical protein